MLTRLAGASVRAALVAMTVAIPAVMLPDVSPNSAELSVLLAVIAATFVVFEYGFSTPSLIEFRFAAPYNRLRFAILTVLILTLVLAFRSTVEHTLGTELVVSFANASYDFWDFGVSPLRSFMALAVDSGPQSRGVLAQASALGLMIGAIGAVLPGFLVWTFGWPLGGEDFNIWMNMPTFSVGDDVVGNLRKAASVSVFFALAFPYLAPQAALAFLGPLGPISASNSQFLVWIIAIWAFVPAVLLLRAVALFKIASMIGVEAPREA